jgi:hypothetical protein
MIFYRAVCIPRAAVFDVSPSILDRWNATQPNILTTINGCIAATSRLFRWYARLTLFASVDKRKFTNDRSLKDERPSIHLRQVKLSTSLVRECRLSTLPIFKLTNFWFADRMKLV